MPKKRFKDFIEDVSKNNANAKKNLHEFYAIVSQPDYTDPQVQKFFEDLKDPQGKPKYTPTRAEYSKIADLHDQVEDKFDCEYRDY